MSGGAPRAVVLVGGRSRRFGRDKLREPYEGGLLVERAIAALRGAGLGAITLVGECDPIVASRGDRAIADDYPGQGPAGGVLTAIERLDDDVLVLAGDLPAISWRTTTTLIEAARARPEAWVVRAAGEPCIAIYRRAVAPALLARLARGERSLAGVAEGERLVEIEVDRGEVANANTEDELARAARPARRMLPVIGSGAPETGRASDDPSDVRRVGAHPVASPRSVRISITDRCDFACTYCRPSRSDGYAETRLSVDAWRTTIDGLVAAGVRRVRITGGEPLVHPRVVEIVRAIADRGVDDLALTTNASQLARLARPLAEAGLRRVNVSIDSLDPARFAAITRGGALGAVIAGIDAAIEAGLGPIKLNTVVLRGVNDDELEPIVRWAWARGLVPRFLEVMPIAEGAKLWREHLVPVAEMRARLAALLAEGELAPEPDRGPARYLAARHDPARRVGFISGTSDTYCASCDRLRVSSTGVLRPCLATDDGVDARDAAERGDAARVPELLAEAWSQKPDGRTFRGCTEPSAAKVSMRAIGG